MTSEIRANKQTNRAGLGTVTYADTGIIVSGIVTCTELSGLTALNIAGVGTASTLDINGDIDVDGHTNLDNVSIAGITTLTSSSQYPLVINGSDNGKIVLQGSNAPYLRFKEQTTDKAYIQWNNDGYLELKNEETNESLRIGTGSNGLKWVVNGSEYKTWNEANDGASSGLDADLLDGQQGSYYITTINNNANNRLITGTGTANTLDAESSLTFYNSGSDPILTLENSGNPQIRLRTTGTTDACTIDFGDGDSASRGRIAYINNGDNLLFYSNGVSGGEKMKLYSDGRFNISPQRSISSGTFFHVEAPASVENGETNVMFEGNATMGARLNLKNNNTSATANNQINFCDAGGQSTSSIIGYNTNQTNNHGELVFGTRNAQGSPPEERMRITSGGTVWVKSGNLQLGTTSGTDSIIHTTNAAGILYRADENGHRFQTYVGGWQDRLTIKDDGKIGISKSPDTKVEVQLAAYAATGDDDASDWGANGIFQLLHQGTAAANNEVLLLGAASGAVGQIASGIGFGRESTSHWGTYLSFKTHSSSTANIDELKERARIKSDGTFEVGYLQPADGSSANRAAKSALEIKRHYPQKTSGNYWILDRSGTPRQIYCEMETDGGGWMLWHDHNAPGSKTSMNIALGGSDASPSSNLSRSYYNNYAYYTVWIKASQIDATGERLHSFVTLDGDGEIKYIADYGADFLYEHVGDQYQPNLNAYFNSGSTGEYVANTEMYEPQCGASGWENFSNGGWSEVYIREMDTRIAPGTHRSLHLVDRIYGFDSNGVPFWTLAESMHPTPHWSDFSTIQGETADGQNPNIQTHNVEINSMNGNNGPSIRARSRGVLTGTFEYTFQLGYNWGWSIASLNASVGIANALNAGDTDPYSAYTYHYYHASLYNNSSNNYWYPTSRAPWQSSDVNQSFSPGINYGNHVLWRETDGTIKARDKSGTHSTYTFPTKFAGPLILCSGSQSPHYTKLQSVWNSNHSDTLLSGRNRWYK